MLDAARFAPSSENTQPWVFVVVRDAERRARLADLMDRLWSSAPESDLAPSLQADVAAASAVGSLPRPVWIVVGADDRRADRREQSSSIFPAVQNLLLAATALGLGSAMTTIASYDPDRGPRHHRPPRVGAPLRRWSPSAGRPAPWVGPAAARVRDRPPRQLRHPLVAGQTTWAAASGPRWPAPAQPAPAMISASSARLAMPNLS